jgi:hypothetical protein
MTMAFCGQCGSLLSPRDVNCPRCGAVTEPDLSAEDVQTDAPTVASLSSGVQLPQSGLQRPAGPPAASRQQKLVLPGDASPASESASIMEAEIYAPPTPQPPPGFNPETSHPGFLPQSNMGYQSAQAAKRRRNGVAVVLLTTLLALLIILGTATVIVLRQSGYFGNNGPPPPALTPAQRAQALVLRYYIDINKRNYYDAYNLWGNNPQHPLPTYQQFARGYANTKHDDIIFGPITPYTDGTVQVNLTVYATEATLSGIVHSVYQGSYIVGQQNGLWKILSGNVQKIG